MPEKSKEFLAGLARMDEAAKQAENDLLNWGIVPTDETRLIVDWLKKWVPEAGWKRLGRIIVNKL